MENATMALLDEKALRRPDFRGGVPVVMADGQEWILPLPQMTYVSDNTAPGGLSVEWDLGEEFNRLSNAAQAAANAAPRVYFEAEMALFRHLLLLNYGLDNNAIRSLLRYSLGSRATPESLFLRESLLAIAGGQLPDPKSLVQDPSPTNGPA